MGRRINSKTIWTKENIPKIKKVFEECLEKKLTMNETWLVLNERGFTSGSVTTIRGWKRKLGLTKKLQSGSSDKKNRNFPNQILGEINDESFIQLKIGTLVCKGYQISQYGNVLGKRGYKLMWSNNNGYPYTMVSLHEEDFKNQEYFYAEPTRTVSGLVRTTTGGQKLKGVVIHTAVANLFLPKPIPECFLNIWNTLTDKQKDWIQSIYIVDHINDDKSNPHINNLKWITPKMNNRYYKQQLKDHF